MNRLISTVVGIYLLLGQISNNIYSKINNDIDNYCNRCVYISIDITVYTSAKRKNILNTQIVLYIVT